MLTLEGCAGPAALKMVSVSQELIIRALQAVLQEPLLPSPPSSPASSSSNEEGSNQHNDSPPTSAVACQTHSPLSDTTSNQKQSDSTSQNEPECLTQGTQTSLSGLSRSYSGVALSSNHSRLPKPVPRSRPTPSPTLLPPAQSFIFKNRTRQPPSKLSTLPAAPSPRSSVLAPVAVAPTDALVTAFRHSTTMSMSAPPPSASLVNGGGRVTSSTITTSQARVSATTGTSSAAAAARASSKHRTIPGPVSRKEYGRYGRTNGHPAISDARCIKRMLTGSAPVKAPVDCFASPEVKQLRLQHEPSSTQTPTLPETLSSVDPVATSTPNKSHRLNNPNGDHSADVDWNMSSESTDIDGHMSTESTKYATICVSRAPTSGVREVSRRHSMGSVSSYQNFRPGSCFSLPKWRPAGAGTSPKPVLASSSTCKGDGASCIPKPSDLRVTRRVGLDGVVIAWSPLDHDCVAGFQVIVGGRVVQQVKSPDRTKAFINGLVMTSSVTIGLISVGIDGRCSKPAVVTCDRTSVYPLRTVRRPAPTRRTAAPTCI